MRQICSVSVGAVVFLIMLSQSSCRKPPTPAGTDPQPGVSLSLAQDREQNIHNVRYQLSFAIPGNISEPIPGKETVRLTLKDNSRSLVLDFEPGAASITSVSVNGAESAFREVNGHVVIPPGGLKSGENAVDIAFRAGDASLNRNPDFMYALFVPARAHLAFPCFDQPDLKARYTLELTVPADWQAVSNGAETSREAANDRVRIGYAETEPIPTYLFTFAAGKFQIETAERNGRTFHMFHRETDAAKVARNRDAVFDLHAAALSWLERYTDIPYPFGKFDFVLIPSFQFGGMEHPGAIYYNAATILLDESATENQMLNRASTISHETSHMWFGDLVTMRWFNDVWMKEVFANFMAAKIVNPSFPKVNHELRFLLSNYPSAYGVDRTAGTHPIRQELDNLNDAGSMYGPIIYQKAPIVMRQLERILGPEKFQEGLQVYLKQFKFGNATWLDLVKVFDDRSDQDVSAWSKAWVEESGRPTIRTEIDDHHLAFSQSDSQAGRGLRWIQEMEVLVGNSQGVRKIPVAFSADKVELKDITSTAGTRFVLPTGGGLAYGDFVLDDRSRTYLLQHLPELTDPLTRGAAWVTLWEELLDRRVHPSDLIDLGLRALPLEDTEQNVQLVLGYLRDAYWSFLTDPARQALSPRLEQTLRTGLAQTKTSSLKSAYFSAFRSVVATKDGVAFLERVWRRSEKIPGLTLAEPDEATMALELAVRGVPNSQAILDEQLGRFQNPDRKARFAFVMPALSEKQETRDAFFQSLADVKNRRREPWAQEGLHYLNHPLRAPGSEKYVRPGLDLLVEIQRTGDIFFPTNWMNSLLGGHNSRAVAQTIRAFLDEHKDYPVRLRRIILQSADDVFRAADIVSGPGS